MGAPWRRRLRGRWEKRGDAAFDVTVTIDENARDSQLDAARRRIAH